MRRLANWLLLRPVPDPELQCELLGWAMSLTFLADVMTWWSSITMHSRFIYPRLDPGRGK